MKSEEFKKGQIDMMCDLLSCGYLDAEAFMEYLNTAENYHIDMEQLNDDIDSMGYEKSQIDINTYFYSAISCIFYTVLNNVQEYADDNLKLDNLQRISDYIEGLKDNFSPFINCLDSWYNNIFDNMTLSGDVEQDFKEIARDMLSS